jgi:membrane protein implicated in regulation of membrane protease activity
VTMFGPIKSALVFYAASAVVVAYLLYTMIRKRKGLRPGQENREKEL